jgi:HK97 family phage major capsid protein
MAYAKNVREQLGRLGTDIQNIVDKAKNENNRGLTSEEREKFHTMEADYTALEDSIKIAEKTDSIVDRLASASNKTGIKEVEVEELRETFGSRKAINKTGYEKAFSNYLRNGERTSGEDLSALRAAKNQGSGFTNAQTVTTSGGGYLIPQGFSDKLEEAMKWFGGIEGTVDKIVTSTGNPMPWPTVNDTSNKGRMLSINTQLTETDFTFGQVTFNAYVGSSDLVLVPLQLIEDSYFDIDALTAKMLGTRLGRLYNNQCTVGSGSSAPNGIVTAAVAAGNIVTAGGSTSSGEIATITYSDIVNLEHAVDPAYRFNPSSYWMFSDAMLKGIKKLVDGNSRPLWQPGLTASFREGAGVDTIKPLIWDHPYIINQDVAVPAASAYSMLFGDMSTFKVRVVDDVRIIVMKERYADYLQVGYTAFNRFDSNLVDAGTHPIAVLQQSAT